MLFWPGSGLALTISSALTHPGVPIAKRVFARDAFTLQLVMPRHTEEAAHGAAMLAAVGVGEATLEEATSRLAYE